jgi:hypothetical protein
VKAEVSLEGESIHYDFEVTNPQDENADDAVLQVRDSRLDVAQIEEDLKQQAPNLHPGDRPYHVRWMLGELGPEETTSTLFALVIRKNRNGGERDG